MIALPKRAWVVENILVVPFIVAVIGAFALWDHREPMEHIRGKIVPNPAMPGQQVTVRWSSNWYRTCEASVHREIVTSDLIVRRYLPYKLMPVRLGEQTSETSFMLNEMQPPGLTSHRSTLRFDECGLLSRFWPIEIHSPPLYFEVAR